MQVIVDPNMTVTVLKRLCRSKKKRIVKKWRKNPKNYETSPSTEVLVFGDKCICHPMVAEAMKAMIKPQTDKRMEMFGGFLGAPLGGFGRF